MADPAAAAAGTGAVVPAGDSEEWTPSFGDMVWGKVKSHPWWPGHVYSISLSDDPEVHRGHRHGLVLVAFFGDGSYGWFEPHELVRFEDHFLEKTSQGGSRTFPAAVAESLDEIARRSALAILCRCRGPDTFRAHREDPGILLVNVPGFDSNAEYLPDQVTAAREKFVPKTMLDFLQSAAVEQRDAAETAARTLPGIEMAAMLMAYRRSRFEKYDITYAESFGVEPKEALEGEIKAEAERSQRARPLKGRQRVPEKESATAAKGRRGAAGAAARLMEKIVPGAPAIKAKASKKDQYLLKRRDDARAPALPPAVLPDATPAPDDGGPPPGFPSAEPQTPPLPSSTGGGEDDEFMLQRRAPPPAGQASDAGATAEAAAAAAPAPKKAAKPKKARKRQREEAAEATADEAAGAGEPKTKKKKKKLAELNGGAPSAVGSGKPGAALSFPKFDLDGLDLKQVVSDLENLPLLPSYGAGRSISDASHSFFLAFRSKHFKKSHENDPPEESKKSLDTKPNATAAADNQPPKPVKKKPVMRPIDPTNAGVKRGPSDRQEEMASKKKIKLEKIKTLAAEKKAGLVQKDAPAPAAAAATAAVGGGTPAAQQPRAGMKEKAQGLVKKKVPAAAPAKRTASPTALMMKFPPKSTLPSVASLKARFARFGPLDIDGIRVYWKSHMCRVIYKFQSDAEMALKYAKANAMFGQVVPNYHLRGVESSSAGADPGPEPAPPAQQQRSDLRLMETTPFRPGSSGNGTPLTLSRAAPARTAVGQPKSILKKGNDDGGLAAASALRDSPRVKFNLDGGDSKLESPPLPASSSPDAAAPVSKVARSVGFAQQPLQPPARPALPNLQPAMRAQQQQLQPPRALDTQTLPPPPPLPYQPRVSEPSPYQPRVSEPSPYQPRHTDAPPSFNVQPPYQPRHSDVQLPLTGQLPLPYPPRAGFPGHQYSPRSDDMPPSHFDNNAINVMPPAHFDSSAANAMPVWKRGEKEFKEELMRVMLGIAKLVEPLMDKNGNFPYHLFGRSA